MAKNKIDDAKMLNHSHGLVEMFAKWSMPLFGFHKE